MPDVISDATLSLATMEEGMDDDELVYGVNGDPMLSSPHAIQTDALLDSPSAHNCTTDPLLCEQRLPTPTSHIEHVDGDTLDIDMIAWLEFKSKQKPQENYGW